MATVHSHAKMAKRICIVCNIETLEPVIAAMVKILFVRAHSNNFPIVAEGTLACGSTQTNLPTNGLPTRRVSCRQQYHLFTSIGKPRHSSSPDDATDINGTFNACHVCFRICLGTSWLALTGPRVRPVHGKHRQPSPRHSSSRVVSIESHDCRPNWCAKRQMLGSRAVGATLVSNGTPSTPNESSAWHITRLNAASRVFIS